MHYMKYTKGTEQVALVKVPNEGEKEMFDAVVFWYSRQRGDNSTLDRQKGTRWTGLGLQYRRRYVNIKFTAIRADR